MLNIAVFISGGGTNLQAIINAVKENKINGKIKLVFSNRKNAYGLIRAQNESIDTFYLNRKKFFCNEEYDERILEELERRNIDLIVLAGYLNILSLKFVHEKVDTGAIILQDVVPVYINDDFETVAKRVLEIEHKILVKTVKAFCDNKIVFKDNRAFIVEE